MDKVSVCIVTRNRKDQLIRAIKSVDCQNYDNIEIVVVDNNSTDGTSEAIRTLFPEVKIIKLHKNIGCPPARNIGMANTTGEYILSLDDDGYLDPTAVKNSISIMEQYGSIGIVMFDIIEHGKTRFTRNDDLSLMTSYSGGACLIRAEMLKTVGYYEDAFFRQAEEVDYSIRMFENNFYVAFSRKCIMYHCPEHQNIGNNDFTIMTFINKAIILIKFAPVKRMMYGLLRSIAGHGWLMFKQNALLKYFQGLLILSIKIPYALKNRKTKKRGYLIHDLINRSQSLYCADICKLQEYIG
ncbi:MAG: glycosyltransferase family 2 protein [Methanococcaceae archaeon]